MKSEIDKVLIKIKCILEISNLTIEGKKQVLNEILNEVDEI